MLFNSIQYALFLPVVFALYWLLARVGRRWQNVFLLVASYYFYGSWDIRFLGLLAFSTLLDYYCGIRIGTQVHQQKRRIWLWISLAVNLGLGIGQGLDRPMESDAYYYYQLAVSLAHSGGYVIRDGLWPKHPALALPCRSWKLRRRSEISRGCGVCELQ